MFDYFPVICSLTFLYIQYRTAYIASAVKLIPPSASSSPSPTNGMSLSGSGTNSKMKKMTPMISSTLLGFLFEGFSDDSLMTVGFMVVCMTESFK